MGTARHRRVTRPVPLLAETVAVLAGASSLRWRQLIFAAVLGALPSAFLYAWAGASASRLGAAWVFGAALLIAVAFVLIGRWLDRPAPGRPRGVP